MTRSSIVLVLAHGLLIQFTSSNKINLHHFNGYTAIASVVDFIILHLGFVLVIDHVN